MSSPLQLLSHYPAIPPPVSLQLWESAPHPCSYLPGRMATIRALVTQKIPPEAYHAFMDANFRRSGQMIYQPACAGCRACQSLRVIVSQFKLSKSQRRCERRNHDLAMSLSPARPSQEKFALYRRYLAQWHGRDDENYEAFCDFLYRSPVQTIEFEHRDASGRLLAVGICDASPRSLSSVYYYFEPSECERSLGTFGAIREIQWAAAHGIPHYYFGYWIEACGAMRYKASFHPHQILGTDGVWRDHEKHV